MEIRPDPIGYRRNGQPIYPIAGGDGEGEGGGGAGAGTATLTRFRSMSEQDLATEHEAIVTRGEQAAEAVRGGDRDALENLRAANTDLEQIEAEMGERRDAGSMGDRFRTARAGLNGVAGSSGIPGLYGQGAAGSGPDQAVTPGEIVVNGEAYRSWMKRWPGGGPPKGVADSGEAETVGIYRDLLGMRTATDRLRAGALLTPSRFRALISAASGSAGTLVRPDWMGLLEPGLVRPLTLRALVTTIPVQSDTIEYIREVSRISAAAPVAEATGVNTSSLADASGRKAEGGIVFAKVVDAVKTIAEWTAVTKRILSDAPALRAYVDQYLTDDVAIELEDQMAAGDGTGENFLGILQTPGIGTAGPPGAGKNMLDAIRTAKRMVRVNARTNATAVLINPEDAEIVDTLKASGTGNYLGIGPFATGTGQGTIWGLPAVESEAVPPNTALVGDFRRAVLFDREETTITVGTANDDFIKNVLRVLAEMRAGFGVLRPAAFVAVTLS
jgi:HK97 family phage major capsid protein